MAPGGMDRQLVPDRNELIDEVREVERDLAVFKAAKDLIEKRAREMVDNPERQKMFWAWPATQAALNVHIMAIVRCEGLLEDYRKLLEAERPASVVDIKGRPHD